MEASLPISATVKTEAASIKGKSAARPNAHAPSTAIPLRFVTAGLLSLFLGALWLVVQPAILAEYHYNSTTIAATHLFILGWIVTTIMGAMYQLVPVALETTLYSERLARWQFVFHVVGFAGMVWMFHAWNMKQVGHFGCVLASGLTLFVYNIVRTLCRVPKWNVVATAIASALFWISCTATAGLSIVASKCAYDMEKYPATTTLGILVHGVQSAGMFMAKFAPLGAMHAHAHLGIVGFLLMLIIGVSYKLVPMFTLSEIQSPRRAGWSVALLNAGLAGAFITVLLQSPWKPLFGLVIVAALALYGWELVAILRARKRRAVDWGIRYFLTAVSLLAPLSLIGLALSRPGTAWSNFNGQLENVYGFVALIGVVTFAIIGMLYKILPFLVWFNVYSRHIGCHRVPALAEMYSARLQAAGYWTFLVGLLVTSIAIFFQSELAVRCGCIFLAVSVTMLAINIGRIASHYLKPRLAPLAKHPPL